MRTHCDTCHGTGFVTGYYQPIDIQITFDSDPKKQDLEKEWENVYDTKRARMCNYPIVRPKDLVINKDDYKRYVIKHVDTTKLPRWAQSAVVLSKQNYILSQILILEELNPDDNEYFIDVDNIPPIPIEDEGRTGSTLPFFNDHKPVTTDLPLTISSVQHLDLLYNTDEFAVIDGKFALKDGTGVIGTESFIASEIIPNTYTAIALTDDGEAKIAKSNQVTDVNKVVGIGVGVASTGQLIRVQHLGNLTNNNWHWIMGKSIFYDVNGHLTQSPPLYGYWIILGRPITSTTVRMDISVPIIRP
jgi:hypothetical protein